MVHAPGAIADAGAQDGTIRFVPQGWPKGAYHVLVAGLKSMPRVRVDGIEIGPGEDCRYGEGEGRLVLRVRGKPRVEIELR